MDPIVKILGDRALRPWVFPTTPCCPINCRNVSNESKTKRRMKRRRRNKATLPITPHLYAVLKDQMPLIVDPVCSILATALSAALKDSVAFFVWQYVLKWSTSTLDGHRPPCWRMKGGIMSLNSFTPYRPAGGVAVLERGLLAPPPLSRPWRPRIPASTLAEPGPARPGFLLDGRGAPA